MSKILIATLLLFCVSCSSSITKIRKTESNEIVRDLNIPLKEEIGQIGNTVKESVPVRVRLYHMPRVSFYELKRVNEWPNPPHIYEYDYAEEQYIENYITFDIKSIEKSKSMNIIDYINSNIKDPSGFQQNHKKRFLLGL